MSHHDEVLAQVAGQIRQVIAEDWIQTCDIGPDTRFGDDLELESIEFVRIADALQMHYGAQLGIIGWLSGKSIHELIGLSVGDLVNFIAGATAPAA